MRRSIEPQRVGFTLIELLVVIAIIGILISLILVAAADGVRRAEERATQALITKLETALNDRLDALLNTQAPINQTHRFLAAINFKNGGGAYVPVGSTISNSDDRRAQVFAQFDYIRAELPDVFFLNSQTSDGSSSGIATLNSQSLPPSFTGLYPLNFAAAPYPSNPSPPTVNNFILPLGNTFPGLPLNANGNLVVTTAPDGTPLVGPTGVFGASFSAAGGIYKNLGYSPTGYDGVDNNTNGYIDEYSEGIVGLTQDNINQIASNLVAHKHKTARAEMLYAVLVEGLSPLGSAFSREDFTSREVQDTDGDGLPEFIDAWGEPLQFFRWPTYYGGVGTSSQPNPVILGTSDSQIGCGTYGGTTATRQQDPLDTNQLLVSPGWWANAANPSLTFAQTTFSPPNGSGSNQSSPGAIAFMNYFHTLVDPYPSSTNGSGWDRGNNFNRREYFTKFLILSSGPDREPGVAQFNKDYSSLVDGTTAQFTAYNPFPNTSSTMEHQALSLIYIENQAAVSDPVARTGSFYETPDSGASSVTTYLYSNANSDDITNHNISGVSTGVR